jgi:hypothetical protein
MNVEFIEDYSEYLDLLFISKSRSNIVREFFKIVDKTWSDKDSMKYFDSMNCSNVKFTYVKSEGGNLVLKAFNIEKHT